MWHSKRDCVQFPLGYLQCLSHGWCAFSVHCRTVLCGKWRRALLERLRLGPASSSKVAVLVSDERWVKRGEEHDEHFSEGRQDWWRKWVSFWICWFGVIFGMAGWKFRSWIQEKFSVDDLCLEVVRREVLKWYTFWASLRRQEWASHRQS